MTDLRKAAEIALDALEKGTTGLAIRAIPALRQALAQPEQAEYDKLTVKFGERAKEYLVAAKKSWQPEQEPVTWAETNDLVCALLRQAHDVLATASYPMRRPWVGLTDWERNYYNNRLSGSGVAEDIEFELKGRNGG